MLDACEYAANSVSSFESVQEFDAPIETTLAVDYFVVIGDRVNRGRSESSIAA